MLPSPSQILLLRFADPALQRAAQLLLYVLTNVLRFITKRQAVRLLGITPAELQSLLSVLEPEYVQTMRVPTPEPVLRRLGPAYQFTDADYNQDFTVRHPKRFEDTHLRWVASDRLRLKPEDRAARRVKPNVAVLAAMAAGAQAVGGVKPGNARPFRAGVDLNVAEMIVRLHELAMREPGPRAARETDIPAGNDTRPRLPDDGTWKPGRGISPFLHTTVPAPGRVCREPEYFSLLNFRWHATALFGEDHLLAHKLQLQHYTPELAIVENGSIVHAIGYGAGYGKKDVERVFRSCLEKGCTFELWA